MVFRFHIVPSPLKGEGQGGGGAGRPHIDTLCPVNANSPPGVNGMHVLANGAAHVSA